LIPSWVEGISQGGNEWERNSLPKGSGHKKRPMRKNLIGHFVFN